MEPGGPAGSAPGEAASPLDAAIGLRFHAAEGDAVLLRLEPAAVTHGGGDPVYLHGGVLATCVDTAAWEAVVRRAPGAWVAVDLRVDFLRPAGTGPHLVRAHARRVGRRLAAADVEISPWDDPDRLVALGRVQLARTDV
jgi:uncharacterized protein (TIGR00369 family)